MFEQQCRQCRLILATFQSTWYFDFKKLLDSFRQCWVNQLSWLVLWIPLKNMKVNWDDYSQYVYIYIYIHGKWKMIQTTHQYQWSSSIANFQSLPEGYALRPCSRQGSLPGSLSALSPPYRTSLWRDRNAQRPLFATKIGSSWSRTWFSGEHDMIAIDIVPLLAQIHATIFSNNTFTKTLKA